MVELIPFTFIVLYLVPFMVAAGRDHPRAVPILLANVLLGWTVVGWLAVLAWALLSSTDERASGGARRSGAQIIALERRREVKPRILHHL